MITQVIVRTFFGAVTLVCLNCNFNTSVQTKKTTTKQYFLPMNQTLNASITGLMP